MSIRETVLQKTIVSEWGTAVFLTALIDESLEISPVKLVKTTEEFARNRS